MRWIALLLFFFGLFSFNPELKAQTQLGGDIDGELGFDHLGSSVSISADGTRIAAGAPDNNMSTGYTKIYEWNGTNWVQLGGNIIGEAAFNWSGSSVALNANGSRVAIGANGDDENGNNSGHVRIYEWNGSTWVQLGSDIDGEAAEDESGRSVSISSTGDRVAIGAYGNSDNGSFSGHVRIYEWNGTTWIQMGSDIDGETAIDLSGLSVALSSDGSRIAIGASLNDGNGNNAGHVRVYEWNGSAWVQLGSDIDGENPEDQSGVAVALSSDGSRVAIGAYQNDGTGNNAGHVRIYEWNGTTWIQMGSDIDGENPEDRSGVSVALSANGTVVAIGATSNNNSSGHVRIYGWNGSAWAQLGSDIDGEAASDASGRSISISAGGNSIAIGAPENDENGDGSGHVRVYSLVSLLPVELSTFEGNLAKDQINLYWITASEEDNKGFDIQRLGSGKDWQTLGFVKGKGNSTITHHYNYTDPQPQKGINYYRLKQIDFDGAFEYSKTIAVTYEDTEEFIQVYPNPTAGTLNLNIDNPAQKALQVSVHNNLGQTIWQSAQIENTFQYKETLQLNKSGLYYITVRMGTEFLYERVVVE